MTSADDFGVLFEHGLLGKTEFVDGRILIGLRFQMVFDPEHARAAADVGVRVRTCVDAVLEDPEALAEILRRLSERDIEPEADPRDPTAAPTSTEASLAADGGHEFELLLKVDGVYTTAHCTTAADKLWVRLEAREDRPAGRAHPPLVLCIERARLAPHLAQDVREWEERHAPNELLRDATVWLACSDENDGTDGTGVRLAAAFSRSRDAHAYVQRQDTPDDCTVIALLVDELAQDPHSPGRPLSRMRRAELLDEARFASLRLRHCRVECRRWHELADDYQYELLQRDTGPDTDDDTERGARS